MYLTDFLKTQTVHDAALHAVRRRGDEVLVTLTLPEGGPRGGADATLILRGVDGGSEGVGPCPGEVLRMHTELDPDGRVDVRLVALGDAGGVQVFGWNCGSTTVALTGRSPGVPSVAQAPAIAARLLAMPPAFDAEAVVRWRRADGPRWDPRLLWFERHAVLRGRWLPDGTPAPGEVTCGFDAEGRLCCQRLHGAAGAERTEFFTEPDGRVAIHRTAEGSVAWALRLWTDAVGRPCLCAWQGAEGPVVERYHYDEAAGGRLSHLDQRQRAGWVRHDITHDAVGRVVAIEVDPHYPSE